jgi:hypothetical protein
MAFALFHIIYFMKAIPPRFRPTTMLVIAIVLAVFTVAVNIWNIVYLGKYMKKPAYNILVLILGMIFVSLQGFLFAYYMKNEELISFQDATISGPPKDSYLS